MSTQPKFTPPVFQPVYRAAPIASCPECLGDCIDEGTGFWCPACRKTVSPADVGWFERDHDDYF